jgi:transcriptional regulator with XRE-family HTH domain
MPPRQPKTGDERLARLIRERREQLGLTRQDLAARTGLSYPYISQLETAYRLPSSKVMTLIARSLQLPASDLFEALPDDTDDVDAVAVGAAPPPAAAAQWIANPSYQRPAQAAGTGALEAAARSAISALEALSPHDRLDALSKVQAAVLAGVVRDQASDDRAPDRRR